MRGKNLVKISTIVGFVLAEIYMALVVLAPNVPGYQTSRMIIPKESIPAVEGVAPGAKPPVSAQIERLAVCAIFFGPFGAFAGLGVGLLLEGARQKFTGKKPGDQPPS
jgi:hypothetical protein